MRQQLIAAAVVAAFTLGVTCSVAHADTLSDIFTQGHVKGQLRSYYFTRDFHGATKPNVRAFANSALLDFHTGSLNGFSFDASFAGVTSFGTQSSDPAKIDSTLMGIGSNYAAMTQGYVEYKQDLFQVKAGYQFLNTPWMGGSDSRIVPASYKALTFKLTPIKGFDLYALRSLDWKSRTSSAYFADNLYYPSTTDGDAMYGGIGGLSPNAPLAKGAAAFGASYQANGFKGQLWYYDFLHFAKMTYGDADYIVKTGSGFNPYFGGQILSETGGSDNYLVMYGDSKLPGSQVKANAWGLKVGVKIPRGDFFIGYNKISSKAGAVGGGAIISPYTAAYATDPLYTTSMIRGLVEEGPGHAWKAKFTYDVLPNLKLMAAYAKYSTVNYGSNHNVYFDVIYKLGGYYKGLTLRDRIERSSPSTIGAINPSNHAFTYNRVMISYDF